MTCPELDVIAAYCLSELDEAESAHFEEHYFGCERCLARTEAMAELIRRFGVMLPHVLTEERRRRVEASGKPLAVVDIAAGTRATMRFGGGIDVGIWVLRAPLADAKRIDFEARTGEGATMFAFADVPFDAERGQVVLGCRSEYGAFHAPHEFQALLFAVDAGTRHLVGEFTLNHEFENP